MIQNEDKQDKNTTQKTKKMRKTDLTKNSGVNPGVRGKKQFLILIKQWTCYSYIQTCPLTVVAEERKHLRIK